MYAVLKTGGKQYRVEKEDVVLVEKLDANDGDQVVLNDILMIGEGKKVTLGSPLVNDAAVMAQVIRQTRGPKITMIYKRRRKNSRRKQGHKQNLTLLKIIDIAETGGSKLSPKKASIKSTETKSKVTAKSTEAKAKVTAKSTETKAKATGKSTETKAKATGKSTEAKAKATGKSTETKAKASPKTKSSTTKDK
jgi:large subunit ribosomal protein L21